MKTKKAEESAAMQLLSLVWRETNTATAFSWERLNHAMRAALELAIGAGMKFAEGDFGATLDRWNPGRWLSESDEWCYALAVEVGNRSAIAAYEAYRKRGSIIADDVDTGDRHSGYLHLSGRRQRERLAVGFKFPWYGEQATVTSMPHGDGPLVACSYAPNPGGQYRSKILHRYKITAADIIKDRKRRKLLDRLQDEVSKEYYQAMLLELGNPKNKAELLAVPVERIERAAEKFLSKPERKAVAKENA